MNTEDLSTAISDLEMNIDTASLLIVEAIEFLEELAEVTGKGKKLMAIIERLEEARDILDTDPTGDVAAAAEACHANP